LAEFKIHPASGTYFGMRFQSTAHAWTSFGVSASLPVNQTFANNHNFVVTSMDIAMLRPTSTIFPDVRARIWQSSGTNLATSAAGSISSGTATPTESNFVNCSFGSGVVLARGTTYRFGSWTNGDIRYGRRASANQEVRRVLSNSLLNNSDSGVGEVFPVEPLESSMVIRVNYIHAPSAPTSVTSTGVTSSSVNISWGAPSSNGDSAITGYNVRIGTSNPPTSAWVEKAASATTHTFSSLSPGTTYYFQVVAKNAATTQMGTTSLAGSNQATTIVAAPVFSDQSITTTWIKTINFSSAPDRTVLASNTTGYAIIYSGSGINPTGWLTINSSGQLSGLPSSVGVHTFVIRASGAGGNTDSSLITLTVNPPGDRATGSTTRENLTIARRFDGSNWIVANTFKRFDGTSWQDIVN
jgi:hypothetical protein